MPSPRRTQVGRGTSDARAMADGRKRPDFVLKLYRMLKECPELITWENGLIVMPSPAKLEMTAEQKTFFETYRLELMMEQCTFKMKKRLTVGPKEGVKFLISDAGDFFTEESKKLKAAGGPVDMTMTAEELAAKDAADKKAKREKEAKAEAERDAADSGPRDTETG